MAASNTSFAGMIRTREPADSLRLGLACGLAGLLLAALFSFVIYPRIAGPAGAVLDPDGHGALGWGIYKLHTFSFYPNPEPTVTRGPLYPMVVAGILELSPNAWPYNVQIVQNLMYGLTCVLTFLIGRRLFGVRAGWIAGMLCAVYPLLVWYSARIWIETMTILIFTGFLLVSLHFMDRPSLRNGALLGLLIGLLSLAKGTFLPFVVVVPLYFAMFRRKTGLLRVALIPLVAALTILPWTIRNWRLTGHVIPVHSNVGFNIRIGDVYTAHARESHYNFLPLWLRHTAEAKVIFDQARAQGDPGWLAEIKVDDAMLALCLQTYKTNPLFLVKKMFVNATGFWMLSESTSKSIISGIVNLPLLSGFGIGIFRMFRGRRMTPALTLPLVLIGIYYVSHLPFLGFLRYCSIIIPMMIVYAVGGCMMPSTVRTSPVEKSL
jgi:4-amino-4-deoxy-L-arabinose transferase-like glycosyltransferase